MSDPARFEDWNKLTKHTVTFHTLSTNGFELKADILLPPTLKPSSNHPLIISYHGGGLIFGSRDHYFYQAAWLPSWAAKTNAIILSPDYRLLPQAGAQDIIDDIHSLWSWIQSSLSATLVRLEPEHGIDMNRIIVQGGSAGGFTAGHLALSQPEKIRAAILIYPMLDGLRQRGESPERPLPGQTFLPREQMLAEIEAERGRGVPTVSRMMPADKPSYGSSLIWDREAYDQAFGHGEGLQPVDRIGAVDEDDDDSRKVLPERVWIMHGRDDTVVAAQHSERFVKQLALVGWDRKAQVELTVVDGEPSHHGFDSGWNVTDAKLKKHLDWIEEVWLR